MSDIPEGFAPHFRKSPLTDPWEPLYSKETDKAVIIGFRAGPAHTNSRGFVHGGLLSALADNAMGLSCAKHHEDIRGLVTVTLTVDFLGSAELGQWIEVETGFVKPGRSLYFCRATITGDASDKPIALATATLMRP